MGLDMYLTGERFLWDDKTEREPVKNRIAEILPEVSTLEVSHVTVEAAYWRKANAIHDWFVKNVQDGVDECQKADVSKEDMQKLLETINAVLADHSKAPELIPTASGFFFGDTSYGEYYFEDLKYTKERLELLLSPAYNKWSFYYRSSW